MTGAIPTMSDIWVSSESAVSQIGKSFKSYLHTNWIAERKYYRIELPKPKTIVEVLVVHDCQGSSR